MTNFTCNIFSDASEVFGQIDWEIFSKFIEAAATFTAAFVAWLGIRAWRTIHIGKKQLDIAEETLILSYKVRDLIKSVRSEYVIVGEEDSDKKVRLNAIIKAKPLLEEFANKTRAYKVLIGEKNDKHFEKLNEILDTITVALMVGKDWTQETVDKILYQSPNDDLSKELDSSIKEIEKAVRLLLRKGLKIK